MSKPIWQQRLQEKLDKADLVFVRHPGASADSHHVKHRTCLAPQEKAGKKVTLRHLTNFSDFNTCIACKVTVR